MDGITGDIRKCLDACVQCEQACKETVMHCLHHGGEHSDPGHIGLMQSCAAVCKASSDVLINLPQDFAKDQCALCAEICIACAESCDEFDEAFMKKCAQACLDCANACEIMSQ